MMYTIKWYSANHTQGTETANADNLNLVLGYLQLAYNITKFDIAVNNNEDDLEEACRKFNAMVADISLDDDDEDEFDINAAMEALEEEARQELKAYYAKLVDEAFRKVRFNTRKYNFKGYEAFISPVTQIAMANAEVTRAIQELKNNRDNYVAVICLPNGQQVKFKKFTGSRENGYQIGLVYTEVDNGTQSKVRSYRTTIDWMEQMKRKPISELADLKF